MIEVKYGTTISEISLQSSSFLNNISVHKKKLI